jgi:hypothetical protein
MEPAATPIQAKIVADRAAWAEAERIYAQIDDMWTKDHVPIGWGLYRMPPDKILETPNWERGWAALQAWWTEITGIPPSKYPPQPGDMWIDRIHITSHDAHISVTGNRGHSLIHARLERQLADRVIYALVLPVMTS